MTEPRATDGGVNAPDREDDFHAGFPARYQPAGWQHWQRFPGPVRTPG